MYKRALLGPFSLLMGNVELLQRSQLLMKDERLHQHVENQYLFSNYSIAEFLVIITFTIL